MFDADYTLGVNRWPLVKLRAGSRTEVTLLSRAFFCLTTHWVGHTMPCCGDYCRLCEYVPARGLFSVAVTCQSRLSIVELGSQSASMFEQHAKLLHGGMKPGLVFLLSRKSAKHPVSSEVLRYQEGCDEVFPLDLATHVMCVYKFPPSNPGDDLAAYEIRLRQIAKVRCDRAADLLCSTQQRAASRQST